MLADLGSMPSKFLEIKLWIIGRSIGFACHLIGWFLPMYFAGKLETNNVCEYEKAAGWARELGLEDFLPDLHEMAAVEVEHEKYFFEAIGRTAPVRDARRC